MSNLFRSLLGKKRAARADAPHRDFLAEEIRRRRSRARDAAGGHAPADRAESVAIATRGPSGLEATRGGHPASGGAGRRAVPEEMTRGIDPAVLRLLTPQIAREFGVLPLRVEGSAVVLAVAQEPTLKLQNDVRWLLGIGSDQPRRPVFERIPAALLEQCLDVYYPYSGAAALLPAPAELFRLFAPSGLAGAAETLRPEAGGRATVRSLVNGILLKAVYRGASDILFECFETEFRVRFKVEGSCEYALAPLPPSAAPQVVSVIKQHARLDIAETERSQDGRFDMKAECNGEVKSVQFRVAIRPTINGEVCVVRLHDNAERRPRLDSVGADPFTLSALERVRDHRGGLVVFCGPTGSGKTTTLAAILGECDSTRENIITIEDPVEIRLPGVTQSAVNEAKGETFARMLKTTLRVAPDRILVGEVRDAETAHLVIKAALTGHQVLTTVHSEDAPKAVTRMLEEGISPFNLASVLFVVVAQRLLNRVCEHCAVEVTYPDEVLLREQFDPSELGSVRAREARGCSMCYHKGTYGRAAIFETLAVTDEIRDVVARRPHDLEAEVRRAAILGGMRPLRRSGLDLVRQGAVSLSQVVETTPYVPADALAYLRPKGAAAAAANGGEWDWIRPLEIGAGDEPAGDAGVEGRRASGPGDRPRSGPIILGPGSDGESAASGGVRVVDACDGLAGGFDFDILETLADHARAEARAPFVGGEE